MDVADADEIVYADALRLMRERRHGEAEGLLERLRAAPATALEPWIGLGLCFIAQGKTAHLFALVELRQRQAGDGLKLFYAALMAAGAPLGHAATRRVIEGTPRNNLLFIVALFVAGVIAASDGDSERAIELVKSAGEQAKPF